jgi:hypothetical protein
MPALAPSAHFEATQMSWNPEQPLTLPPPGTLLMDCTEEQRAAVEEDKRRWMEARRLIRQCPHHAIRRKLENMPEPLRTDMRRRLNAAYEAMREEGRP